MDAPQSTLYSTVVGARSPAKAHSHRFRLNGLTVRITAASRSFINDLRTFFEPYFTCTRSPASVASWELESIVDAALFEKLRKAKPEVPDGERTVYLTHDESYKLHGYWLPNDSLFIDDARLGIYYAILPSEARVRAFSTPDSKTFVGLQKVIRGLWVSDALSAQGALMVHACALERNERGLAIAGDKYAGKTTALLAMSSQKKYNIVANDLVILRRKESSGGLVARGVPTVVNLRPGVLRSFPIIRHLVGEKYCGLRPVAQALAVDVRPEVTLSAFVFISYEQGCDRPVVRTLSSQQSRAMLATHTFSIDRLSYLEPVMDPRPEAAASRPLLQLLRDTPCFHLSSNNTDLAALTSALDRWCQHSGASPP
jgi:hypothetical protein